MAWTATSYLTRMDLSTGEFARRGLAMFKDGEGRVERQSPNRNAQSGTGNVTDGTGRWAGVSGATSSVGKGLTAYGDSYTEFKADYSLPAK